MKYKVNPVHFEGNDSKFFMKRKADDEGEAVFDMLMWKVLSTFSF